MIVRYRDPTRTAEEAAMKIVTPSTTHRAQGIRLAQRPSSLRGRTGGFLGGRGRRGGAAGGPAGPAPAGGPAPEGRQPDGQPPRARRAEPRPGRRGSDGPLTTWGSSHGGVDLTDPR